MRKAAATLFTVLLFPLTFAPAQQTAQSGDPQSTPARFRAAVDQVVLYAAVYDDNGELVSDLKQEDFQVFEDRVQQEITYFALEDVPTTLGVVMDRSGSMRPNVDRVNQATELFLSLSNPANELFLLAFNHEAQVEEEFTTDLEDIRDALDNLIVTGGTALYDAIYLASDLAAEGTRNRKVLLVFTDGEDKDSYYTSEELLEHVREAEVQIYLIAFLDPDLEDEDSGFFGVFDSRRESVMETMSQVAEETGGKAFFPEKATDLKDAFATIARELRSQYRLAYVSSNQRQDNGWRRIRVRITGAREKGLKVRARKGYYPRDPSGSSH